MRKERGRVPEADAEYDAEARKNEAVRGPVIGQRTASLARHSLIPHYYFDHIGNSHIGSKSGIVCYLPPCSRVWQKSKYYDNRDLALALTNYVNTT